MSSRSRPCPTTDEPCPVVTATPFDLHDHDLPCGYCHLGRQHAEQLNTRLDKTARDLIQRAPNAESGEALVFPKSRQERVRNLTKVGLLRTAAPWDFVDLAGHSTRRRHSARKRSPLCEAVVDHPHLGNAFRAGKPLHIKRYRADLLEAVTLSLEDLVGVALSRRSQRVMPDRADPTPPKPPPGSERVSQERGAEHDWIDGDDAESMSAQLSVRAQRRRSDYIEDGRALEHLIRNGQHKALGHSTINDFVSTIGIHPHHADLLRRIYRKFVEELGVLPERMTAIPIGSAQALVPVINADNLERFLNLAASVGVKKLRKAVRDYQGFGKRWRKQYDLHEDQGAIVEAADDYLKRQGVETSSERLAHMATAFLATRTSFNAEKARTGGQRGDNFPVRDLLARLSVVHGVAFLAIPSGQDVANYLEECVVARPDLFPSDSLIMYRAGSAAAQGPASTQTPPRKQTA